MILGDRSGDDVPAFVAEAAERADPFREMTDPLDAVRDEMILERLQPAQEQSAIEADANFIRSIRSATMKDVAGIEERAAASHDCRRQFLGFGFSLGVPAMASRHDDRGAVVRREVGQGDVDADEDFGSGSRVVVPGVGIAMEELLGLAAAERHEFPGAEMHGPAKGFQEVIA